MPVHERETVNKQFQTTVEKVNPEQTKLIVVRDTSGSMGSACTGTNMTCYDVAKALALYFSEFLSGQFANHWIEFNSNAVIHEWKGNTPTEKWFNDNSSYIGSTDFQSVIDLLIRIKQSGVPESDFPSGILCISDSEFNPSSLPNTTNHQEALIKLRNAGFSDEYVDNFIMIFWNLQSSHYGKGNTGNKFETYGNINNVYYFSGFEGSVISFLTAKVKTAWELFLNAMNQESLNRLKL